MKRQISLYKCPVCSKALFQGEAQYHCNNKHSFDIARKGYVNLLLRKDIGAGDPGDNKEMIGSRREFLSKGFYENFSDKINDIIIDDIKNREDHKEINLLDAGCGEGYYLWRLKNTLVSSGYSDRVNLYGIDVSKPAIHIASRGDKSIHFAVGSTFHIPLLDSSMDTILCVFSPRDEKEFLRVLKPWGKLIVAAPGPRHLFGLKMALYHESEEIGQKGTVGQGFHLVNQFNVSYDLHLETTEDILNLLTMTPYYRHVDESMVENLKRLTGLKTEVDFNIMVYVKV